MPQIRPITDLRNTTEISDICHARKEPVFITKNGYGDMVLMSMEAYEESLRRLNIYRELALSEKEFEEGKYRDASAALKDLRTKYEL